MGMILSYIRVSPANAEVLLKRPELVHGFLGRQEDEPTPRGFLGKWFGKASAAPDVLEPRDAGDEGDADKSWHGMHWLFTGTAEGGEFPASFILLDGEPVGDEDVGYGPARIFRAEQVHQIDSFLQGLEDGPLKNRFDPALMDAANVYPQGWERDGAVGLEYIMENVSSMRGIIRDAAARGHCLLLYLC